MLWLIVEILTPLQMSVQLVMPGVWLSDLCQERYEVREKKASKKVTNSSH